MTLRMRLFGSLGLMLVALTVAIQSFWIPTWMEKEARELRALDEQALQILAASLVDPLLSGRLSSIEALLSQQLEENPHWRHLSLEDALQRPVFPLEQASLQADPHWVWLERNLTDAGYYVGHLRLAVDHRQRLAEERDALQAGFMALVAMLVLGFAALAWLQDRWVRQPVARLTEAVTGLADRGGAEALQLPDGGVEEIRRLLAAFRSMRAAIERREAVLHLHRQRLQAVLDSVQDAIFVVSEDRTIVDVNPAVRRIFGYPRDELIGAPIDRVLPRVTLQPHYSQLGYEADDQETVTRRGKHRDGHRVPVEVVVSVVSGSEEVLYSVLARDVAGRLEREEHNRRLLAEIQATISLVPGVVLRLDGHNRMAWWNERFLELCQLNAMHRQLVHQPFLEFLHPEDREAAERALDEVRKTGEGEFQGRLAHQGRTSAVHLFRAQCLRDEEGSVVMVGVDIEPQLAAQQILREARDQAVALARSRFNFLANVSHEIRTPLNGVLGMLELLTEYVDGAGREYLDTARRSGEHLLSLLNDILDLSKLEAGQLQLEEMDFALGELVEDVVELFGGKAREKGLELGWEMAPGVPEAVRGDRTRLWQVLANLLSNAIKFTERGHVVLRVLPAASGDKDMIEFQVEDTGIGISPEVQGRIFEPFQQAAADTTRRFGGTGLGLALCRQLVRRMGGQMSLRSTPGEGSCFVVRLPLPAVALREGSQVLAGRRVLVVDDLLANRKLLQSVAQQAGAQVHVAEGATEALERIHFTLADGKRYDLLLVDAQMPGMDGFELLQRLRELPELEEARKILMLTRGDEQGTERARALGVETLLFKPLRRAEVLRTLVGSSEGMAPPVPERGSALRMARRFQGRVLLVEDNAVNQKVAQAFLERLGLEVDCVADGEAAVAAWAAGEYDLVLMDIQMPVMDGYTATQKIRERERDGRRTPIVALTANAMEGDEARCLEAGMDDYLAKPLRPEALQAVVARWLGGGEEAAQSSAST